MAAKVVWKGELWRGNIRPANARYIRAEDAIAARIVSFEGHYTLECEDGKDAMGETRWVRARVEDYAHAFMNLFADARMGWELANEELKEARAKLTPKKTFTERDMFAPPEDDLPEPLV